MKSKIRNFNLDNKFKKHYKLYKSHKKWIVMPLVTLALIGGGVLANHIRSSASANASIHTKKVTVNHGKLNQNDQNIKQYEKLVDMYKYEYGQVNNAINENNLSNHDSYKAKTYRNPKLITNIALFLEQVPASNPQFLRIYNNPFYEVNGAFYGKAVWDLNMGPEYRYTWDTNMLNIAQNDMKAHLSKMQRELNYLKRSGKDYSGLTNMIDNPNPLESYGQFESENHHIVPFYIGQGRHPKLHGVISEYPTGAFQSSDLHNNYYRINVNNNWGRTIQVAWHHAVRYNGHWLNASLYIPLTNKQMKTSKYVNPSRNKPAYINVGKNFSDGITYSGGIVMAHAHYKFFNNHGNVKRIPGALLSFDSLNGEKDVHEHGYRHAKFLDGWGARVLHNEGHTGEYTDYDTDPKAFGVVQNPTNIVQYYSHVLNAWINGGRWNRGFFDTPAGQEAAEKGVNNSFYKNSIIYPAENASEQVFQFGSGDGHAWWRLSTHAFPPLITKSTTQHGRTERDDTKSNGGQGKTRVLHLTTHKPFTYNISYQLPSSDIDTTELRDNLPSQAYATKIQSSLDKNAIQNKLSNELTNENKNRKAQNLDLITKGSDIPRRDWGKTVKVTITANVNSSKDVNQTEFTNKAQLYENGSKNPLNAYATDEAKEPKHTPITKTSSNRYMNEGISDPIHSPNAHNEFVYTIRGTIPTSFKNAPDNSNYSYYHWSDKLPAQVTPHNFDGHNLSVTGLVGGADNDLKGNGTYSMDLTPEQLRENAGNTYTITIPVAADGVIQPSWTYSSISNTAHAKEKVNKDDKPYAPSSTTYNWIRKPTFIPKSNPTPIEKGVEHSADTSESNKQTFDDDYAPNGYSPVTPEDSNGNPTYDQDTLEHPGQTYNYVIRGRVPDYTVQHNSKWHIHRDHNHDAFWGPQYDIDRGDHYNVSDKLPKEVSLVGKPNDSLFNNSSDNKVLKDSYSYDSSNNKIQFHLSYEGMAKYSGRDYTITIPVRANKLQSAHKINQTKWYNWLNGGSHGNPAEVNERVYNKSTVGYSNKVRNRIRQRYYNSQTDNGDDHDGRFIVDTGLQHENGIGLPFRLDTRLNNFKHNGKSADNSDIDYDNRNTILDIKITDGLNGKVLNEYRDTLDNTPMVKKRDGEYYIQWKSRLDTAKLPHLKPGSEVPLHVSIKTSGLDGLNNGYHDELDSYGFISSQNMLNDNSFNDTNEAELLEPQRTIAYFGQSHSGDYRPDTSTDSDGSNAWNSSNDDESKSFTDYWPTGHDDKGYLPATHTSRTDGHNLNKYTVSANSDLFDPDVHVENERLIAKQNHHKDAKGDMATAISGYPLKSDLSLQYTGYIHSRTYGQQGTTLNFGMPTSWTTKNNAVHYRHNKFNRSYAYDTDDDTDDSQVNDDIINKELNANSNADKSARLQKANDPGTHYWNRASTSAQNKDKELSQMNGLNHNDTSQIDYDMNKNGGFYEPHSVGTYETNYKFKPVYFDRDTGTARQFTDNNASDGISAFDRDKESDTKINRLPIPIFEPVGQYNTVFNKATDNATYSGDSYVKSRLANNAFGIDISRPVDIKGHMYVADQYPNDNDSANHTSLGNVQQNSGESLQPPLSFTQRIKYMGQHALSWLQGKF